MNDSKLGCVMLVDDNEHDNFFHERAIEKSNSETIVVRKQTGIEALEYLKSTQPGDNHPDLIFLDINMPHMNGWEFLESYNQLDKDRQSRAIIIMLTTSSNPEDEAKAKTWNFVADFTTKPLTVETLKKITDRYFKK